MPSSMAAASEPLGANPSTAHTALIAARAMNSTFVAQMVCVATLGIPLVGLLIYLIIRLRRSGLSNRTEHAAPARNVYDEVTAILKAVDAVDFEIVVVRVASSVEGDWTSNRHEEFRNRAVYLDAASDLADLGNAAVRPLIQVLEQGPKLRYTMKGEALRDTSPQVLYTAISALEHLGHHAEAALPAIAKFLSHRDSRVRACARDAQATIERGTTNRPPGSKHRAE